MKPGMKPAVNRPVTETLPNTANMIMEFDGGIKVPIVPPAAVMAAACSGLYEFFIIEGMRMAPMAAVVAVPEPAMAAKEGTGQNGADA